MKEVWHGQQYVHEYRIIHPNGQIRWAHERVTPIMDENNTMVRIIGVAVDITSLKSAEEERERVRKLLERTNRLSALGQLAAGIAHEIRNPLTSLMGFIKLIERLVPERVDYIQIMTSELHRIESIVNEFLLLSKPSHGLVGTTELHDLRQILQNTVAVVQAQTTMQNITIATHFDDDVPPIWCNEDQLKQVWMNFLRNSIDAMPNGGTIEITLQAHGPGGVLVRIHDEGCGIPRELLSRIGEPFFTTKQDGTGLGMVVTQQIIDSHGGKMVIDSEVDKGTTVTVTLPAGSPD